MSGKMNIERRIFLLMLLTGLLRDTLNESVFPLVSRPSTTAGSFSDCLRQIKLDVALP